MITDEEIEKMAANATVSMSLKDVLALGKEIALLKQKNKENLVELEHFQGLCADILAEKEKVEGMMAGNTRYIYAMDAALGNTEHKPAEQCVSDFRKSVLKEAYEACVEEARHWNHAHQRNDQCEDCAEKILDLIYNPRVTVVRQGCGCKCKESDCGQTCKPPGGKLQTEPDPEEQRREWETLAGSMGVDPSTFDECPLSHIPNAETAAVLREGGKENLKQFNTVEELMDDLNKSDEADYGEECICGHGEGQHTIPGCDECSCPQFIKERQG